MSPEKSNVVNIGGPGHTFRGIDVKMIATKSEIDAQRDAIKRGQKMFEEYCVSVVVTFNPHTRIYNVVRTPDVIEFQQIIEQLGGRVIAVLVRK